jgi:hypothetical protein
VNILTETDLTPITKPILIARALCEASKVISNYRKTKITLVDNENMDNYSPKGTCITEIIEQISKPFFFTSFLHGQLKATFFIGREYITTPKSEYNYGHISGYAARTNIETFYFALLPKPLDKYLPIHILTKYFTYELDSDKSFINTVHNAPLTGTSPIFTLRLVAYKFNQYKIFRFNFNVAIRDQFYTDLIDNVNYGADFW